VKFLRRRKVKEKVNPFTIFKSFFAFGKQKTENGKQKTEKQALTHRQENKSLGLSIPQTHQRYSEIKEFPTSPVSKRGYNLYGDEIVFPSGIYDNSFRIKLYRFLKDNIPVLNSAIWTWTRICSSPSYFQLKASHDEKVLELGNKIVKDLDQRIFQHNLQKFGGIELLLSQFFGSLFTDGAVCGEITLTPTKDKIDKFYFIDPATVRFKLKDESIWELYQEVEGRLIKLNPHSTFYYGLDVDSSDPRGKSILSSIPFVARIEQRLLEDMNKTMHNAGYYRIHVKIKPPERLSSESDDAYIQRANRYFEDTIEMMKKISLEDNPVTWNDVEINYIGSSGQYASATSWYINHKSLIEDICAGVHLDPFMLGYSYGPSYNWAQIKYELILRNVISIQSLAKRFLEWIRNLELALHGIPLECICYFDNRKTFGLLEKYQAEKVLLENVVKKMEAGFISKEEGKREMEQAVQ
jgi:hypothetical protein